MVHLWNHSLFNNLINLYFCNNGPKKKKEKTKASTMKKILFILVLTLVLIQQTSALTDVKISYIEDWQIDSTAKVIIKAYNESDLINPNINFEYDIPGVSVQNQTIDKYYQIEVIFKINKSTVLGTKFIKIKIEDYEEVIKVNIEEPKEQIINEIDERDDLIKLISWIIGGIVGFIVFLFFLLALMTDKDRKKRIG